VFSLVVRLNQVDGPGTTEFLVLRKAVLKRLLNEELPNLLWLFGGIQARVQAMRLSKLCLSGLGVVEAEQSHPQVIVRMGKCRVEAHSFAVTQILGKPLVRPVRPEKV